MPLQREIFSFHDLRPAAGRFRAEVLAGLSRPRKALPPKYFYDERGCALFEAICRLPEYYPTRTETAIMRAHAREMARRLGRGCMLIEYGSGNSRKTRILIAAAAPAVYVPIDIAAQQLRASCRALARLFPRLAIIAVCADYTRPLALPPEILALRARRVIYFPGSTIGNFTVGEARRFLANARALAGPGGGLLIGVDLKKDRARLEAAYDDARGVTAAFNLNLLARVNRELGADFDLSAFRHRAFYNAARGRVEMHLVSAREQRVRLAGRVIRLRAGETIHTENSYKYSVREFQALARSAGLAPAACWTDAGRLFAVHYLVVPPRAARSI
ncbi:MAG TPA: L-histidine N(alpha)-methyltransferase [Burkholderiales bacterium]|nr:L-histidine N(alpha)-methyltransferase [Burkholderiales bacterium]